MLVSAVFSLYTSKFTTAAQGDMTDRPIDRPHHGCVFVRTRVMADGDDESKHVPLSLLLAMPLIVVRRDAQ